ncbi:hypothetical protein P4910_19625 [Pantoea stewartii]|uniref:hypothetical protein n=1 Tax=Enterobacterales TaxID=91347 RepID=UPI0023F63747|nr:hypothetical protein [Pantoea stewartii]MDF7787670.1 hypothetical protein [Pantoea stewartii]
MLALTTEAALNILTEWLQDNISCGTVLIFDNDEDRTDSATLLPWIEQARKDVCALHQLRALLVPGTGYVR